MKIKPKIKSKIKPKDVFLGLAGLLGLFSIVTMLFVTRKQPGPIDPRA